MQKNRRQIAIITFLACVCLILLVHSAQAADPNYLIGNSKVVEDINNVLNKFGDTMLKAARSLFFGLSVLSLGYGLYRSILIGESNLGTIAAHLTKWIIYVGLFMWIMSSMDHVFFIPKVIVNSFAKLGSSLSSVDIQPDSLLETGIGFYALFVQRCSEVLGWTDVGPWLTIGIMGLLMLFSFYILSGIMVVTLIEIHIVICTGAVLLGFAGFDHTRDVAFSYIKYAISAGMKILTVMVVYGVAIELTKGWPDQIEGLADWKKLLSFASTALGTSFSLLIAAKMVPSMAQSMVNGAISGFGHEQIAATAAGLGRGVTQAGRTIVDTVRGARNTQTATFRGIASAYDAAKEGGAVGAAGYVAASTPGVRNLVSAAKSGGLRNMAGYVAATALFGSQSERAQKYLSRNEETMTPGNRSMTTVPAPGNANVSSPESVAERILRS